MTPYYVLLKECYLFLLGSEILLRDTASQKHFQTEGQLNVTFRNRLNGTLTDKIFSWKFFDSFKEIEEI